jgi:hypothetical protein
MDVSRSGTDSLPQGGLPASFMPRPGAVLIHCIAAPVFSLQLPRLYLHGHAAGKAIYGDP